MLKIDRINVFYGDVHVLWDLSLFVSAGEIVTIIGPNGAGKSTLLKTVVNLLKPAKGGQEQGKISFQGQDLAWLSPEDTVRLGMAIVPEGSRVFPDMTVLDNLLMGSYTEPARSQRARNSARSFRALSQTGRTHSAESQDFKWGGTPNAGHWEGSHVPADSFTPGRTFSWPATTPGG